MSPLCLRTQYEFEFFCLLYFGCLIDETLSKDNFLFYAVKWRYKVKYKERHSIITAYVWVGLVGFMVLNAPFNNISVISWQCLWLEPRADINLSDIRSGNLEKLSDRIKT
jgi:hypothetical protein